VCSAVLAWPVAAAGAQLINVSTKRVVLKERDGRLVGTFVIAVRAPSDRSGHLEIRYLRGESARPVLLPGGADLPLKLLRPASDRPLARAPAIGPDEAIPLTFAVSVPRDVDPAELDGRIAVGLRTGTGSRAVPANVVPVEFRRARRPSVLLTLSPLLAVISTFAAMLAALLSWRSARETREARREDKLPLLTLSLARRSGTVAELTIMNSGGGAATHTYCCIVLDKLVQLGAVDDGLIAPGDRKTIVAAGWAKTYEGVVQCWDARGDCYVWDVVSSRRKRVRRSELDPEKAFELMHERDPTGERGVEVRRGFAAAVPRVQ